MFLSLFTNTGDRNKTQQQKSSSQQQVAPVKQDQHSLKTQNVISFQQQSPTTSSSSQQQKNQNPQNNSNTNINGLTICCDDVQSVESIECCYTSYSTYSEDYIPSNCPTTTTTTQSVLSLSYGEEDDEYFNQQQQQLLQHQQQLEQQQQQQQLLAPSVAYSQSQQLLQQQSQETSQLSNAVSTAPSTTYPTPSPPRVLPPYTAADIFGVPKSTLQQIHENQQFSPSSSSITSFNFAPISHQLPPMIRNTPNTTAPLTPYEQPLPVSPITVQKGFFEIGNDVEKQEEYLNGITHQIFCHTYYQYHGPQQLSPHPYMIHYEEFTPCTAQRGVLVHDTWRDEEYYTSDDVCFCNRCVFIKMSENVARGAVLPLEFDEEIPLYLPGLTNHCRSKKNRRMLPPIAEYPECEELAEYDDERFTAQAPDPAMIQYLQTIAHTDPKMLTKARIAAEQNLSKLSPHHRILEEIYITRFLQGHLNVLDVDNVVYPASYTTKLPKEKVKFQEDKIANHRARFKAILSAYNSFGNSLDKKMKKLRKEQRLTSKNSPHYANLKQQLFILKQQYQDWRLNPPPAHDTTILGLHHMAGWSVAENRAEWVKNKKTMLFTFFRALPKKQLFPSTYKKMNKTTSKKNNKNL